MAPSSPSSAAPTRASARKRAASAKPELDQQEATKHPRKVPAKKAKPAKAPGRNRKMEPEDDACADEPDEEEMAMGEEDDAGEQEQPGREEAPAARKRVAQPSRVRHTADGDREPEFHGDPFPDHEGFSCLEH